MTGLVVDREEPIPHPITTPKRRWRREEFNMTVTKRDVAAPSTIEAGVGILPPDTILGSPVAEDGE